MTWPKTRPWTRGHKYKAKATTIAGYSFQSKGEAKLFELLKLRELAGEISDIQVQDHVYLTRARILYIPDFKFFDHGLGDFSWAEFKGIELPQYRIKRRLWMHYGPGILTVWKENRQGLFVHETIKPKGKSDEG